MRRRSSSFLKKRTKKLLLIGVPGPRPRTPIVKSFLVLFFRKELLLLLLLSSPAFAVSDPSEMLKDPKLEARAEAIGSQLRCLVCQNESIEDSQAPLAHDIRREVREHVIAGNTNQQVIDWAVSRYGNFIRLRPPLMASTVLLYATPALGLIIGGLAAWFGRRRAVAAMGPAPLSAAEQARLRELTGQI